MGAELAATAAYSRAARRKCRPPDHAGCFSMSERLGGACDHRCPCGSPGRAVDDVRRRGTAMSVVGAGTRSAQPLPPDPGRDGCRAMHPRHQRGGSGHDGGGEEHARAGCGRLDSPAQAPRPPHRRTATGRGPRVRLWPVGQACRCAARAGLRACVLDHRAPAPARRPQRAGVHDHLVERSEQPDERGDARTARMGEASRARAN